MALNVSSMRLLISILLLCTVTLSCTVQGSEVSQMAWSTVDSDGDHRTDGSARLFIETGAHIQAYASAPGSGMIAYRQLMITRHRLTLVLNRQDVVEWGITLTRIPHPGITTLGITSRITLTPEFFALLNVSSILSSPVQPLASQSETTWSGGLEWQRIADPLSLSASIGYASKPSKRSGEVLISGSASLLVNDTVSVSATASVEGLIDSIVHPVLGTSLVYKVTPSDTVYAKLDTSLAPADSVFVSVGFSHEFE